jgi:hypothetical protein
MVTALPGAVCCRISAAAHPGVLPTDKGKDLCCTISPVKVSQIRANLGRHPETLLIIWLDFDGNLHISSKVILLR